MKIQYGVRMARYDLLRALCRAASCITKLTEQQDIDMFSVDTLHQVHDPVQNDVVGRRQN
eukprot:5413427-Pyramimonas_sp.AAC.1